MAIANKTTGRSFRGLTEYFYQKGECFERLSCGTLAGQNPRELSREVREIRATRSDLATPIMHRSISLAEGETLTNEQWSRAVNKYMVGMGYEYAPWLAGVERTPGHMEHAHIGAVSVDPTRLDARGRMARISDSQDFARSAKILQAIEQELGLRSGSMTPGEASEQNRRRESATWVLHKDHDETGPGSKVYQLQARIDEAVKRAGDLTEFRAMLALAGVETKVQMKNGQMAGISYRLEGLAVKGSELGRDYAAKGIERRLENERAGTATGAADSPEIEVAGPSPDGSRPELEPSHRTPRQGRRPYLEAGPVEPQARPTPRAEPQRHEEPRTERGPVHSDDGGHRPQSPGDPGRGATAEAGTERRHGHGGLGIREAAGIAAIELAEAAPAPDQRGAGRGRPEVEDAREQGSERRPEIDPHHLEPAGPDRGAEPITEVEHDLDDLRDSGAGHGSDPGRVESHAPLEPLVEPEAPAPTLDVEPVKPKPEYTPTFEMTEPLAKEPEPEPVATDEDPLGIREIMAKARARREALDREAEEAVEAPERVEPTLAPEPPAKEPETVQEAAEAPEPTLTQEETPEPPETAVEEWARDEAQLEEGDLEDLVIEAENGDELAREKLERMAEGQDADGDGIEDHAWAEDMRRLEEVRAELEAAAARSHDALDRHHDHLAEAVDHEGYMWTRENAAKIQEHERLAREALAELQESERERDEAVKREEELIERLHARGIEVPESMVKEHDADLHRHVSHIHTDVADRCHHEGQADLAAKHRIPEGTTGGEKSAEQRRLDEEEEKRMRDRMESAAQRPAPGPKK